MMQTRMCPSRINARKKISPETFPAPARSLKDSWRGADPYSRPWVNRRPKCNDRSVCGRYVTAYASDAPEAYNDQEYAWVSAYAAHAFQFVKRLTREERRKWGYAGVWEIAAMRSDKCAEPQIPVELPWRCLKMHSDLHGLILDPFAGLGTTLIACEQSGRRCRAVESDPLHCDLIVRRWEQFTGEKAEKIER